MIEKGISAAAEDPIISFEKYYICYIFISTLHYERESVVGFLTENKKTDLDADTKKGVTRKMSPTRVVSSTVTEVTGAGSLTISVMVCVERERTCMRQLSHIQTSATDNQQ